MEHVQCTQVTLKFSLRHWKTEGTRKNGVDGDGEMDSERKRVFKLNRGRGKRDTKKELFVAKEKVRLLEKCPYCRGCPGRGAQPYCEPGLEI